FNGRDLTGWTQRGQGDWRIADGTLVAAVSGRGWLMSDREYSDFELELEYKLLSGANSGVFLRAWPEGEVSGSQFVEVQLLDDRSPSYSNLPATQTTGSLFNLKAPHPAAQAPINEWNRLAIRANGRDVAVKVNGTEVLDANLDGFSASFGNVPGLKR